MLDRDRLYRTEAIVLREMNYGEADRILTLLTPRGKVSAIAKGIRRPTSRKVGHLGLFCRSQVLVARGRNLDIVTQAEGIEELQGLRSDLLRFTYACYAGELMDRFAQEEDDSSALFELMVFALRWVAQEEDLRLGLRYFELHLLRHSGYQPQLFSCVACGEQVRARPNFFSDDQGGVLCERCGSGHSQCKPVSLNAQKVLRYLQRHAAADIRALRISSRTHREIEALLLSYLEYVLERELKSVAFLRRLRREPRASAPRAADGSAG